MNILKSKHALLAKANPIDQAISF